MRKPWTEQTISSTSRSELDDGTTLTGDSKRLVYETRIGAGDFLMGRLKGHSQRITGFVSASAIGYYGFTDRSVQSEGNGEKGMGSGADLSGNWEKAGDWFKEDDICSRVTKIGVPHLSWVEMVAS
ncbi:hypothetical protein [Sphingobacterium mizutaii]|uniref:hypothetical protein n=1 Tax=Sphingobacterium mizutaii TaxID=1010 RepID=UPI003D95669A